MRGKVLRAELQLLKLLRPNKGISAEKCSLHRRHVGSEDCAQATSQVGEVRGELQETQEEGARRTEAGTMAKL